MINNRYRIYEMRSLKLDNTPVGSGQALDRNELLKMLNSKSTENDK